MANCQDCIHYKVCYVVDQMTDLQEYKTAKDLKDDCEACILTADVVPISEMSIIGVQNMALENTNVDLKRRLVIAEAVASTAIEKASDMIIEAKREVAREIFEEIDSMIFGAIIPNDCAIISVARLAELKKKHTGDQT